MSKTMNPPKTATLTAQLRWHLKNCGTMPVDVARKTGIHSSTLYRYLGKQRGLSDDSLDRLAKFLRLRLIRE